MKIIGVTGISGSGKTTVTRMLAKHGGYPVETDPLVHTLMRKGQPAYDDIVEAFGAGILDDDGEIHRPALGKQVFGDRKQLARLESILHPKVAAETARLIAEADKTGKYSFAIIDAPLLIEAGMHKDCDSCWLVTASTETKLTRIINRDGITLEAAAKRLASRAGDEALMPYADVIIDNSSDVLADLEEAVANTLKHVCTI